MQVILGKDSFKKSKGIDEDFIWDSSKTVNPNMLLLGMTGTGKTFTLTKIIEAISNQAKSKNLDDFRINVFDVHGDIVSPNESVVNYSETCGFGINPLTLSTDPEHGGVRKRIRSFINTVQKSTARLGIRQESITESILTELYFYYGFIKNQPETWGLKENQSAQGVIFLNVPFEFKDKAKKLGARWNPGQKSWYISATNYTGEVTQFSVKKVNGKALKRYPTLSDAAKFIYSKMEESYLGFGREGMLAINELHKATSRLNKLIAKNQYGKVTMLTEEEEAKLTKAKENVMEAVEKYLSKNATEKTLEDALLYTSLDTLTSIYQRISNMLASGIFKDTPPPFDASKNTYRHNLRALSHEEQKMFVLFSLERLFEEAVQKGETKEIREVIVVDEASKFFDDDPRNPLNYIALEGRKFGLCLIGSSQAPNHFSESFLGSVATKIILGLDEMYWDSSKRKLNISPDKMKWITPRKEILVQIKNNGVSLSAWKAVRVAGNSNSHPPQY